MPSKRYYSAKEAAAALDISTSTLYAYVSRGLIRSEPAAEGKRQRRYYAEDIERLLARKEGRRNPEALAKDALHWGAPVLDSAITLIDDGNLYYRGQDLAHLVETATTEEVAALIWTGDADNADALFNAEHFISADKYETMLLHVEVDGAALTPIQALQTFLPAAAADDLSAYDLRPATVATTGARILRLMTSVTAGEVPEDVSLATMLQRGWCAGDASAQRVLDAALIVLADHELNASSFTARVVASAGSSPYTVVIAGLAALQGVKHGGYTERVAALLREAQQNPDDVRELLAGRLRRGDPIPGVGHRFYPDGDPRARLLLELLADHSADDPTMQLVQRVQTITRDLIDEEPSVDFALVAVQMVLGLPRGSALALFALGRTIGWIGHAIEEYEQDRLIRPRARYIGQHPSA